MVNRQYGKWSAVESNRNVYSSNLIHPEGTHNALMTKEQATREKINEFRLHHVKTCIRRQYQESEKISHKMGRRDLQTTYKDLKSEYKPHNSTTS